MDIPKDVLNHVKDKISTIKDGEIEVDINKERNKMDVVVKDSIKTNLENIVKDMKDLSKTVDYGKIRIKCENTAHRGLDLRINVESRKRFKKNGKKG
jgi:hypothetical protein